MPDEVMNNKQRKGFFGSINWGFFLRTRLLSYLLFTGGIIVLTTQVVFPLIIFKTQDNILRPMSGSVLGMASGFKEFEYKELKNNNVTKHNPNEPEYFYLSIPSLGIKDAKVETNPQDLDPDTALGRYTGTSLPGEKGNVFIYGHSVLPFFYNPKNYKTIFSTLGDLEKNDKIIIRYNNNQFTYKVSGKSVVRPERVDPLAKISPGYLNDATIVLMTCWPAGTKTNRLLINGILEE